jgi:hypothetical protein
MCIIVDANAAHDLSNLTLDGRPVLRWLLDPKAKSGLVIGGKTLRQELQKAGLKDTLAVLSQAGRLHIINDTLIEKKESELGGQAACKSNDGHVVALALVAKCDVVFTRDILLHQDLKANSLTGQKIAIYQNHSHSHLLTTCSCPSSK